VQSYEKYIEYLAFFIILVKKHVILLASLDKCRNFALAKGKTKHLK